MLHDLDNDHRWFGEGKTMADWIKKSGAVERVRVWLDEEGGAGALIVSIRKDATFRQLCDAIGRVRHHYHNLDEFFSGRGEFKVELGLEPELNHACFW